MFFIINLIGSIIYIAIAYGFFFSAQGDLNDTADADERVGIRRKSRRNLVTFSIVYFMLFIPVVAGWAISKGYDVDFKALLLDIAVAVIVSVVYSHRSSPGITREDAKQMWRKDEYVLLLRPFSNDRYENDPVFTSVFESFPEPVVIRLIERYTPCLAVGQPSELTGAKGAERVYLSLDHWKEEIQELIQDAKSIVVNLAETDSCLWEIDQLSERLDKVVLFADDNDVYNHIREKSMVIPLPEVDLPAPFYVCFEQGAPYASAFYPTDEGYRDAIDELKDQYFI